MRSAANRAANLFKIVVWPGAEKKKILKNLIFLARANFLVIFDKGGMNVDICCI